MSRKLLTIFFITALIVPIGVMSGSAVADDETVEKLMRQIEELQARVDELEAQNSPQEEDSSWDYFDSRRPRRWDPFAEMDRMQAEMNRMFEHAFSNRGPSHRGGMFSSSMGYNYDIDMKENDDGYEITMDMKGLDKDKVDIQINPHSITIKGEHSAENSEQGPNQYFKTQSFGSFMQTIPLPTDADTAGIKTEKKGDTLVITMPKKNT